MNATVSHNQGFLDLVRPSQDQLTTIYIIAGYAAGILLLWNIKYLKEILLPFKILTVALHEFGHASVGWCTGAKIQSIEVNPDEGGSTKMKGGNLYLALPAGYLGSSFWGSLMIVAGFNVTFSKVVAGIIMFCMLLILYWAKNWLTRGMTVLTMAILGVLWWFKDGIGLRYFVLFLGVMSALYSLWDIVEDLIVRRVNESDAAMFSKICCKGAIPAQVWGVIWFLISMVFVAAAIIIALIVFKDPNAPL